MVPNSFRLPFSIMATLFLMGCNNAQTPPHTETAAQSTAENDASSVDVQTVRVVTESSYQPFSYKDAEGNLIGFEIELIESLCDQAQVTCDVTSKQFDELIPSLLNDEADLAIAAISITSERLEVVDFTDPYYHTGLLLIAPKDATTTLQNAPQGYCIGVQRSTVSEAYLEDNYPNIEIKSYPTREDAYTDLVSGNLDAVLTDKVPAIEWLNTSPDASGFGDNGEDISTDGDALGIALRKNDPLLERLNDALAELKANGQYDSIAAPYFGTELTAAASETMITVNEPINAVSVNDNAIAARDEVVNSDSTADVVSSDEMVNDIDDDTSEAEAIQ